MKKPSSGGTTFSRPALSILKAILGGWLFVNIPVLIIMLSFFVVGGVVAPSSRLLFLAIGFFLGWAWWSYTIPQWRRWALRQGAPAGRLQKWAVVTGLTWPKGWLPEKTETRIDE